VQLELALSLPRDGRSVPVAHHVVRAGMLSIGVDDDCVHDVEVALSEACTNVLQHGDPAAEYEVRLRLEDQRCVLQVSEIGASRAGGLWQQPPASVPDGEVEHGRGLHLMRALVDRVGFRLLPGSGSVVSLEKRLTYADAEPAERPGDQPGGSSPRR
jgi:serine/threonine-protein kinase RsbW